MTQYAFYFDGTRCTGCKTCEFACKDYKDLNQGVAYRKVYEVTSGATTADAQGCFTTNCMSYSVSLSCNHCSDPACTKVCPTGAMHKNEETGLVSVDATKCIGCGYCHMACPYNAPKVDREKGHSVKCDGCADRVSAGEKPVCVEACPARALEFGTVDVIAKLGAVADIAPLPASSFTHPNLYIKPSKDALPSGSADGKVVNPLEVQ
ncbi:MAG: 4Fe-4S dicluster domain-containing protein [Raoultibacter sp.]